MSTAAPATAYRTLQDDLTRGGPQAENPQSNWAHFGFSTDGRKWLSFDVFGGTRLERIRRIQQQCRAVDEPQAARRRCRSPPGRHSTARRISRSTSRQKTIARRSTTFGQRYVFGTINQTQLTLQTRVNWILNPRASLQVYMQPLLATGDYDDFKELAAPRTFAFRHYGSAGTSLSYDAIDAHLYSRSGRFRALHRHSRSTTPTSTSSRCG